jgi:FlaA1/EpsC-like NDP-sugar epimerase
MIVSEAAVANNTKTMVLISTDKAVNPTSMMGVSKRLSEMVVQLNNLPNRTAFITVRFGNVLGSAGSVVPLFERQIQTGGPVTVTDREMTRYFMTISEACQLILQACVLGSGGEIFVLNMGEPVSIDYLARQMIRFSGKIPEEEIAIEYTGLRAGEKLKEELFHADESLAETAYEKILLATSRSIETDRLRQGLGEIESACSQYDYEQVRAIAIGLVPEYLATAEVSQTEAPIQAA